VSDGSHAPDFVGIARPIATLEECFRSRFFNSPENGNPVLSLQMDKTSYVYILAGKRNGTLFTGVTSDLVRRVYEQRPGLADGFTNLYKVHDLVYFEGTPDATAAIQRERQIKKWNRKWKLELIEKYNPECETYTMVWYSQHWIPVFTGMTSKSCDRSCVPTKSGRVT
jgi:putative endonuclease